MLGLLLALFVTACDEISTLLEQERERQVASVEVLPEGVELEIGEAQQFIASAFDSEGQVIVREPSDYTWASSNEDVATINSTGEVAAISDGTATITATLDGHSGAAAVAVAAPEEEDPDDPEDKQDPPDFGEWDFILEDTLVVGDVVVPDGEEWLIGANVEVEGNVRTVGGTIGMRPGSSLRFLGADPSKYVGGGMTFAPEFANDIGLWIGHMGVLDIRGTPKRGWNRTGTHETWKPDDEYWIAPTDVGDYSPRRWFPGDPIPQVDPRLPAAEVMNVTRDIVIQGPGHIHIHSHSPQRIEYVTLREMGVSNRAFEGPVLGRYALHLHHGEWGTAGTIIRGVAAINSHGTVFVPHESHGITMEDLVSVNSYGRAFWWDKGDLTHDLVVDGLAASGVYMPEEVAGTSRNFDVAVLGSGQNKTMKNSAVSGARGNMRALGYHWNTERAHREETSAVWTFHGNVAHNNEGYGIRFWFNDGWTHHVREHASYRNAQGAIENGAYKNAIRYSNSLLIDEGYDADAASHRPAVGVHHNSNSGGQHEDGGPARYERVVIEARDGVAFEVGNRNLHADSYLEVIDVTLKPGPGKSKVYITDGKNPWLAHFIRSGVTPDDFEFETLTGGNDGTHILIDHEDGRKWEIRVESGQKIVNER